jgi:hypothetical protein
MFTTFFKVILSDYGLLCIANQSGNNLSTEYRGKGNWDLWISNSHYVKTVWFS